MAKIQNKVIAVVGPTASGKSSLAVRLAKKLTATGTQKKYGVTGSEIISADSRQVYEFLDVYSNKTTPKEMAGIPHHMINVISPKRAYTVAEYQARAKKILTRLLKERKVPIVCGGTGLYVDALLYGLTFPNVPPQPHLRKELAPRSNEALFDLLKKLDPLRAAHIDAKNPRRLIRALEIVMTTSAPVPALRRSSPYTLLTIGISVPRDILTARIDRRLKRILRDGSAIDEVKRLHDIHRISWKQFERLGLGYRLIAAYIQGGSTKKALFENIKRAELDYAKRQMTWFKKDPNIIWIDTPQKAFEALRDLLSREAPASPDR